MSTVVNRTIAHRPFASLAEPHATETQGDVKTSRFSLSRIFDWYCRAVSSPETEEEKADWQQMSF